MGDGCSSEEEYTDISDRDMEEYEEKTFEELQRGGKRLKVAESKRFTCPYCPKNRKITYRHHELVFHATDIARGKKRNAREKANHRGLFKYLVHDAQPAFQGLGLPTNDEVLAPAYEGSSEQGNVIRRCNQDELFAWPSTCILVNIPAANNKTKSGLKEDYRAKVYKVERVRPLWDRAGFSGKAVVEFRSGLAGLEDAFSFEKLYESNHRGKKDWLAANDQASGLYAWIARADDYNSEGIVGKHLRKYRDLKTITNHVTKKEKKKNKFLSSFTP